jgi:Tfp pilus assembly protein PilV
MTAIDRPLQTIRKARNSQTNVSEDTLWRAITNSIRLVADQLEAWGRVFNSPFPTDEETVRETANALQQFDNELIALEFWLASRPSLRWAQLQNQLREAQRRYWNDSIKSAWDIYVEWEMDPRKANVDAPTRKWYKEQRSIAGSNIVAFAHALKQAIDIAHGFNL